MTEPSGEYLAENVRTLRTARALSQAQCAKMAQIPRATWASLEGGHANPTLFVLLRVAAALSVPVDELIRPPRAVVQHFPAGSTKTRTRGGVTIRPFVPESIAGVQIERLELPPKTAMSGVPHNPGSREYLIADRGAIELSVGGEQIHLEPGDAAAFDGDQKHGYVNPTTSAAVAYSVIVLEK